MIFLNVRTFSIYYMIALVFRSRSAGSSVDFSASTVRSGKSLLSDQMEQAESLRNMGKSYLSAKQYSKAALCYAAVLQVIEGVGGAESGELRRRCGLTLAECEIKSGNLYAAIARCSEVIEECPEITDVHYSDEDEDASSTVNEVTELGRLRQALGQAYYRRGVSLSRLEEPELALLDLQEALKKIPDDLKILQRIETAESVILGHNTTNDNNLQSESELEEQLQCIVEDAQANYERTYFSKKQIRDLLLKKNDISKSLSKKRKLSPDPMGGLEGLGDMFSGGVGSSKDGLGAMGGMGGLGALGSMLGSGGGGAQGMLSSLGMMLRMFSGLDNDSIVCIEEIAKAVLDVFQVFKNGFKLMMAYRTHIILSFTFIWMLTSLMPYLT